MKTLAAIVPPSPLGGCYHILKHLKLFPKYELTHTECRRQMFTADALDALGRTEEAKVLRERYGLSSSDDPKPS